MEIEWLKFRVNPDRREEFVQKDAEIWTAALSQYPGFISKEVWISPDDLAEVVQVIRWETFEQWQAIPPQALEQIEAQFRQSMGDSYELLESSRYQIRKFSNETEHQSLRQAHHPYGRGR
ncbi:TIGR03792 family protein [Thermocoleostomius sinensis]|jgi:uncharacterized protein (TIGR03792 family)|uniref:TIGR03792 family protein n=1 Tax=Thermocoleostomius sinensis A174 TaxID=2016057 RepID=A0A9E8ZFM5_9CYAN|nr:TIGR03792 family protein [Thermocoleostomius sinensis]WAL60944.1 TIGR03792 family protein [Thermocoleostomius sinensis A174]